MPPLRSLPGGESEAEIKRAIMTFLHYHKVFCWVNESVGIYDAKRGIYRKKNSLFQKKGVADILGIYKGRPLAIEVKSAKGVLSIEQREFLEEFIYQGGIGFCARNIRDVETNLIWKYV